MAVGVVYFHYGILGAVWVRVEGVRAEQVCEHCVKHVDPKFVEEKARSSFQLFSYIYVVDAIGLGRCLALLASFNGLKDS